MGMETNNKRSPLREDIIQQLEQFSVEVLQTVLALLEPSEPDLEKGT
jgi:hypothetical protein